MRLQKRGVQKQQPMKLREGSEETFVACGPATCRRQRGRCPSRTRQTPSFSAPPCTRHTRNARLAPPSLTYSAVEARRPISSLSTVSSYTSGYSSDATLATETSSIYSAAGSNLARFSNVIPRSALTEQRSLCVQQLYPASLLPRHSSMLHGGLGTLSPTSVHGRCAALEDQTTPPEYVYSIVLFLCILCVRLEAGGWDEWGVRAEADGGIGRKDGPLHSRPIHKCAPQKSTSRARRRSPSRASQSTTSQALPIALRIILKGARNPPHLAPSSSSSTFHVGAARVSHPLAALSLHSTGLHTAGSAAQPTCGELGAQYRYWRPRKEGRVEAETDGRSSRRDGWEGRVSGDSVADACDGKFCSQKRKIPRPTFVPP
ncbi:hypothetical protein C8R45DRAFT_1221452 [Mycena sanguinolenta]|nr:hypothetical protein C8R45DRAFT_1221452 [Mycena sanguinolenta]